MSDFFKLRDLIRIQPTVYEGENLCILYCDLGVSKPLALKSFCLPLLAKLEKGCSSLELSEIAANAGFDPSTGIELIRLLESNTYLCSETFKVAKENLAQEFINSPVRASSHAGKVYPSDPIGLKVFIEEILSLAPKVSNKLNPNCIIAPHIDYQRGASAYAHAYRHLLNFSPDLCILLGTSHKGGQSLFQMTLKDFETPISRLSNDKAFTNQILANYGTERGLHDQFLHKLEHSLDLQLPFLSLFCPETKIVPILVNTFYPFIRQHTGPSEQEEYETFVSTLASSIKERQSNGQRVLIIAAVDMAHIGRDFGDPYEITEEVIQTCSARDQQYLDSISKLSVDDIFKHIAEDQDRRRICGFSSIYSIIDILIRLGDTFSFNLEQYQQSVNPEKTCLVSFAAATITR